MASRCEAMRSQRERSHLIPNDGKQPIDSGGHGQLTTDNSLRIPYTRAMRNRLAAALVGIALVIGLAMAGSLVWWISKQRPAPAILSTASVVQQIQSLSELVTVK